MTKDDAAALPAGNTKAGEAAAMSPDGAAARSGPKKPKPAHVLEQAPGEVGGPEGPEPTRYGDWSFKGIASDF